MMQKFSTLDPIVQALIAGLFTWGVTALGASLVYFFKSIDRKILDGMMGFAAGVMIAASFFSLLLPAIEMAEEQPWIPAVTGFLAGGVFIAFFDRLIQRMNFGYPKWDMKGIKSNQQRSILLVSAITLHNIPEGMAIGVAFGALASDLHTATLGGAIALALGIGIQNFPEGTSVSVPLRREGVGRNKAFFFGQLSGLVEPFAAVFGAAFVVLISAMLPYALSFAAGAMIYVVVEELIPESQIHEENTFVATGGAMVGFALMMLLDVALG